MSLTNVTRRPIGRILLDGGFVSADELGRALAEQKSTSELLGQTLVRMGVVDPADVKAVLSIQDHLDRTEKAVRTAAGVRRMLGELLVQAGKITSGQLEQAISEQKETGEKLGEVLVRLGLVTEQQLAGVLDFQRNQGSASSSGPIRLGELLVTTGVISREQLDSALAKQALSRKKLGEVLVEEGYARPEQVTRGIRIQQMLLTAALVALLAACGAGGAPQSGSGTDISQGAGSSATSEQARTAANSIELTADEFGLEQATFYYSTDNPDFWAVESAIATDLNDPDFRCVLRIHIPKAATGEMPAVAGRTFAVENNQQYEKFPGMFLVFNGQQSTLKKVEEGTISFTADSNASGMVQGSFSITFTDYDSSAVPAPRYHLEGTFDFTMGTYGPAASQVL
jgi:hypothetical protein